MCVFVGAYVGGAATADHQQRILNAFFQVKCTRIRSSALLLLSLMCAQQVFVANIVAVKTRMLCAIVSADAELPNDRKFLDFCFYCCCSTLLLILASFCTLRCAGVAPH